MRPQKRFYGSYAREKIIDALLFLMQCHGFHEITVLMITQEAGVARRTFYLYYQTKEDVLTDYYNVLTREYEVSMGTVLNDIRLAFSETGTCDIENRPQWLPEFVSLRTVPNGITQ